MMLPTLTNHQPLLSICITLPVMHIEYHINLSLLHSVNLILFTLLLVYLILHISPHHGHHIHSHHLSLHRSFTPDLKLICFTDPFLHLDCLHGSWTWTGLSGQRHLFVLTAYIGSRIWEIYWCRNKWPWPLFRGRLRSREPLHHIRHWISRKPFEIEAWFKRTTNWKWSMDNRMDTWQMTSPDPERSSRDPDGLRVKYRKNSWICCLTKTLITR